MKSLFLRFAPPAAAVLVAILLCVRLSVDRDRASRRVGFSVDATPAGFEILSVVPSGPAETAGVRTGDVLLSIEGRSVRSEGDFELAAQAFGRSKPTSFRVARAGDELELVVRPGMAFDWLAFATGVATSLGYLLIGFACLGVSSGYLNGRIIFAFCAAVALELALPASRGVGIWWSALDSALLLLSGFQFATETQFILRFPEKPAWWSRLRRPSAKLYLVALGFSSLGVVLQVLDLRFPEAELLEIANRLWQVAAFHVGLPLWAALIIAILAARSIVYPERSGRVALAILLLGNLPWFTIVVFETVPAWLGLGGSASGIVWNLALAVFPVAVLVVLLRETTAQRKILLGLADEIASTTSEDELAALIAVDVGRALHPQWTLTLAVLGPDNSSRVLQDSRPSGRGDAIAFPGLRGLLSRRTRPLVLDELRGELPEAERTWLDAQRAEVAVPLPSQRQAELLGLILLGPKKSEEPYSKNNLALLRSLAGPVAAALENLRLSSDVDAHQRREQTVLARLLGEDARPLRECPHCGRCFDADVEQCEHDQTMLEIPLPIERWVAERYRIDRKIGQGGMGVVYAAWDDRLKRHVALKLLLASEFGQPEPLRRFEREARLCAGLVHPHIVAVHDFGSLPRGGAFLVMELLEGMSLRTALDRYGPIPPATAADWFDQALRGLDRAHRDKIVHRDIKPANIWLSGADVSRLEIKLLDFGLARLLGSGSGRFRSLTFPGSILGTLPYMSPEQLSGEPVDFRTDLFSVGVVAAECLTGRNPFERGSMSATATAILGADFHLPSFENEWRELDAVLATCLARRPWERPSSAEALRVRLVSALRHAPAVKLNEPSTFANATTAVS